MYLINFIALCFLNQYFSVYLYQFLFSFAHFPVYFSSLFDWMDSFSFFFFFLHVSDQIRSVTQSCLTLCDPMNRSTPGLPVRHQLLDFTQTHIHRVSDAIQPSHPLSSPFPLARNPSQDQSLFQ